MNSALYEFIHNTTDLKFLLVSHLLGVGICLEAAGILESAGISTEMIDLATLYPLDTKTVLNSVANTGYLVTVEEGVLTGGIGAEVITRVTTAGNDLFRKPENS